MTNLQSRNLVSPFFKDWVVRKIGNPIVQEADFTQTIGRKWGTFVDGVGTVTRSSDHWFGGNGSVNQSPAPVTGNNAELKINLSYLGSGKVAFEQKWGIEDLLFSGSNYDMGIEPRENDAAGFWQARMRYTVSTNSWQYETGVDTYTSFDEGAEIERPLLNNADGAAGDQFAWARLVIDTIKKEYISFEFAGLNGIEFRDMKGIALVNRGAASKNNLLVFTLCRTAANGSEKMYTTDWCITELD